MGVRAFRDLLGDHVVVLMGQSSKHFRDLVNTFDTVAFVPFAGPLARRTAPVLTPARGFRFSEAQRQAIIEAYESGATMVSLAKQYDVRREAISKLLRRSGVTIRKLRTISAAQVDEAVQLYATGLSAARIADRLGFDQATIHNHLKKRGVTMRGPHDWHQL